MNLNRTTSGSALLVNPQALIRAARAWAVAERKATALIGLSEPKPGEPPCKCHNCKLLVQVDRYELKLRKGGWKP